DVEDVPQRLLKEDDRGRDERNRQRCVVPRNQAHTFAFRIEVLVSASRSPPATKQKGRLNRFGAVTPLFTRGDDRAGPACRSVVSHSAATAHTTVRCRTRAHRPCGIGGSQTVFRQPLTDFARVARDSLLSSAGAVITCASAHSPASRS